jgi:hypothetical protein
MSELASDKQINYMKKLGIKAEAGITKAEASKLIDGKVGGKKSSENGFKSGFGASGKEIKLTEESIRIGALNAAVGYMASQDLKSIPAQVIEFAKQFESYIRNG